MEQMIDVPGPLVVEGFLEVTSVIPQERILERVVGQIIDVPVPQSVDELVDIVKLIVQEPGNDALMKSWQMSPFRRFRNTSPRRFSESTCKSWCLFPFSDVRVFRRRQMRPRAHVHRLCKASLL